MTSPSTQLDSARLTRLVEISRVLNSATDLEQLLDYIIKEAAALTNSEATSILLLDPNSKELYFVAASNDVPDEMLNTPVPTEGSIAGAILAENKALYIPNVTADPRWNQDVDEAIDFKTKAILGVPMRNVQHQPVGVLEAINKLGSSTFSHQDVETLSTLADLAGVAVEKARLIEQLRHANDELSELDQIKSNFIAIASHELRTPLSYIMGYSSVLREEATPDTAFQVDGIIAGAEWLHRLIQQMLNFQYTTGSKESLTLDHLALTEFVRDVVQTKQADAAKRKIPFNLHMTANPLYVMIDLKIMGVALANLLDNAIAFTSSGGQIDVHVAERNNEAWIWIADTGEGIPNDQLERIFKHFYQVEDHMCRKHEGMGLGLSISRELIELHNGRVWADSELGKGSTFYVVLPMLHGA